MHFFPRFFLVSILVLSVLAGCKGDAPRNPPAGDPGVNPTDERRPTDGGDSLPPGDEPHPGDDAVGDSGGGDSGGGDDDQPIEDCGRTWPVATAGTCDIIDGNAAHLLLRGDVILPDRILGAAEVLVVDGVISCAACDCSTATGYGDATLVACGKGVISPGLINAHDHITFTQAFPVPHGTERYTHRHEWRKGLNGKTKLSVASNNDDMGGAWGEMRQVMAGTTSLFGSGGDKGFLRNLDVAAKLEGLTHNLADYSTFPLKDSDGIMATSGCTPYPGIDDPATEQGFAAYVPHVGEGIGLAARNEFLCMSGTVAGSKDLVFETSAFIHGIGFKASDINFIAAGGTGLIWSPRSNTDLYGATADAPVYDRLGALIALGTDWTATGSVTILRELKCAESWSNIYWGGYFSEADLVAMVTSWSAELLGYGDMLGSLVPGKVADITIWNGSDHPGYRAILDASVRDVALVLRGGVALYGDDALVGKLTSVGQCEAVDVCGAGKLLCAQRELGKTMVALKTELGSSAYGLFFCATPAGEPSCTPLRPGEYDGLPSTNDRDGDGVDDDIDNCIDVFNPTLPLDDGLQADSDHDDVGDACDPCPLNPDTTACSSINPLDSDNDGILNAIDNCAWEQNTDQLDTDGDGKGDACDLCPSDFNPAAAPCPVTIYAIKHRLVPVGNNVSIPDAVVTAVGLNAFFIQVDPASAGFTVPDFSGLYVFNNATATLPQVGNRVAVAGTVKDFHGGLELDQVTVTVLEAGPVAMSPIVVDPTAVAVGGSLVANYEGVLVRVENVNMTSPTATPAPGETVLNEFTITGGLTVDDGLYLMTPFPTDLAEVFPSITGVLRFSWERDKLWPRFAADIARGPAKLTSFSPANVWIYDNRTGGTAPQLLLTMNHPSPGETFIPIVSNPPGVVDAVGDRRVTIPAGATSAPVILVSGAAGGPIELTATFGSDSPKVSVVVLGSTQPALPAAIEPPLSTVGQSSTVTLDVVLGVPAPPAGQLVDIITSGVAITAPLTVTVPSMQFRQPFQVTAGTDLGRATITARVGAIDVTAALDVMAGATVGLLLVEVFFDPAGADTNLEWLKLYNGTGHDLDLAGYSLGWGGANYAYGKQQLTGAVPAGACFIVGGPLSSDANLNPALGQAVDLNPDLQNGGSAADGVALFDVVATAITATTKPIDNVLYAGATNSSRLIGPDGQPSIVHVTTSPGSGRSIIRTSRTAWAANQTPNSTGCITIP
jgi:large repetitive protein